MTLCYPRSLGIQQWSTVFHEKPTQPVRLSLYSLTRMEIDTARSTLETLCCSGCLEGAIDIAP